MRDLTSSETAKVAQHLLDGLDLLIELDALLPLDSESPACMPTSLLEGRLDALFGKLTQAIFLIFRPDLEHDVAAETHTMPRHLQTHYPDRTPPDEPC